MPTDQLLGLLSPVLDNANLSISLGVLPWHGILLYIASVSDWFYLTLYFRGSWDTCQASSLPLSDTTACLGCFSPSFMVQHVPAFCYALWQAGISWHRYIPFVGSFSCLLSFGCLYPWAIVDSGMINTSVWDFTWTRNFSSFGHTCRSGNAGSYGNSMFIFFFWGPAKLSSLPQHCCGRTLFPYIPVVNTHFLLLSFQSYLPDGSGVASHCGLELHFPSNHKHRVLCLGYLSHWV